jgi:hypothetical protein
MNKQSQTRTLVMWYLGAVWWIGGAMAAACVIPQVSKELEPVLLSGYALLFFYIWSGYCSHSIVSILWAEDDKSLFTPIVSLLVSVGLIYSYTDVAATVSWLYWLLVVSGGVLTGLTLHKTGKNGAALGLTTLTLLLLLGVPIGLFTLLAMFGGHP